MGRACMSVAAEEVEAMTRPETARPAMTPPLALPAHCAKANMHTCPMSQPHPIQATNGCTQPLYNVPIPIAKFTGAPSLVPNKEQHAPSQDRR